MPLPYIQVGDYSSPYVFYDHFMRKFAFVSERTFRRDSGPVLEIKINGIVRLLKWRNCTRTEAVATVHKLRWSSQGLGDFFGGVRSLYDFIAFIGKLKDKLTSETITPIILDFFSVIASALTMLEHPTFISFLSACVSFYGVVTRAPLYMRAQSLEGLGLTALTYMLPKDLMDFVKRMHFLSGERLMDNTTWFQDILSTLLDFITTCLDYAKMVLPAPLISLLSFLRSWGTKRMLLSKSHSIINQVVRFPNIYMNPIFQTEVSQHYKKWTEDPDVAEWKKHARHVQDVDAELTKIYKITMTQKTAFRKEPACFAFEGPPGCLKSVTMNAVREVSGERVYVHSVPPVTAGKDFYDTYDGEPWVMLDDLGQQGASQFRFIINAVSSSQFKLDCADVKLKDTKMFIADTILFTTNRFTNLLASLHNNDGIDDVEALWRRVVVFDFSKFKNANVPGATRGIGTIGVKYYNLSTKRWTDGFPPEFQAYLKRESIGLPSVCVVTEADLRIKYISWIYRVISMYKRMKDSFMETAGLSPEEIKYARDECDFEPAMDSAREARAYGISETEFFKSMSSQGTGVSKSKELVVYNSTFGEREIAQSFLEYTLGFAMDVASGLMQGARAALPVLIPAVLTQAVVILTTFLMVRLLKRLGLDNEESNAWESQALPRALSLAQQANPHSSLGAIAKQMFSVTLKGDSGLAIGCQALISGHNVLVPWHATPRKGRVFLTAKRGNVTYYDNLEVVVKYDNPIEDVCVLALPKNLPAYQRQVNFMKASKQGGTWLVSQYGSFDLLDSIKCVGHMLKYDFANGGGFGELKKTDFTYAYQEPTACGSLMCSADGEILGMHVAASPATDRGAALIWSDEVRNTIKNVFANDSFISRVATRDVDCEEEVSGVRLDMKSNVNVLQKSSLVDSPLYGVLPVTRQPSNLTKYGPMTIKDLAKKSFKNVGFVPTEEIEFAEKYMRALIAPYGPITEKEVVSGNEMLAGMNKDSSNGYKCDKDKNTYFDFDNGQFTERLRKEINELKTKSLAGEYDVDDWMWTECPKDEIRNVEKDGVPRSFRISRVHLQAETKRLLGSMVADLMRNRSHNKIMVGVNPYKDWDAMYKELSQMKIVWDGDVGSWDGGMITQVQQLAVKILVEKFRGEDDDRVWLEMILFNSLNTPVAVADDVYVTTHSMPSGFFLTAILNSIINRLYKVMWFFRNMKKAGHVPSVLGFDSIVLDYVYGDDSLNGVRAYEGILNALTMRDFFESIGLTFTNSDKTPIVEPTVPLNQVSFLKRDFVYHPDLKRVMCPLSVRTLYSGLSWLDRKKESAVVMADKIATFQRELFLHPGIDYASVVDRVFARATQEGLAYTRLPYNYLIHVFSDPLEMDSLKSYSWGGSKYT